MAVLAAVGEGEARRIGKAAGRAAGDFSDQSERLKRARAELFLQQEIGEVPRPPWSGRSAMREQSPVRSQAISGASAWDGRVVLLTALSIGIVILLTGVGAMRVVDRRPFQAGRWPQMSFRTMRKRITKHRRIRRTRKIIAGLLAAGAGIKLEIGAGPVKGKNGWTTLDLSDEADLFWNLHRPLPFPDDSVEIIYCSHVLEHFHYPQLMALLKDCRRVLKPRGIFSACVPDASIYVRGYLNHESFDRGKFFVHKPAVISEARMDIVNYIAYMDGQHRYMFDPENLVRILSEAGFAAVRLRDFDPALDLAERKYESIYALGIKS